MRTTTLLLFLAACGTQQQNAVDSVEFSEAAPDIDALTLDEDGSSLAAEAPTREDGGPSTIAGATKEAVKQFNDSVRAVLAEVKAMTEKTPDSSEDGERVWTGEKKGLSYRLTVRRERAGQFAWLLEAKKVADTEYVGVMRGGIRRGAATLGAHRGKGHVGIDLTKYAAVAEGTEAAIQKSGLVFAAFSHSAAGAHLLIRLKDFRNAPEDLPNQARFSGYRLFKSANLPAMSFARAGGLFNIKAWDDTASEDKNERVNVRLRRLRGVGGFGRAIITKGNLPEGAARLVRECWRAPTDTTEAIYARIVYDCAQGAGCSVRSKYPADAEFHATNPEAPGLGEYCFGDVAATLRARLKLLVATDPALDADPAVSEDADTAPVDVETSEQTNPEAVESADLDAIEDASDIDGL